MDDFPSPPFPEQQQPVPGATDKMDHAPIMGRAATKAQAASGTKRC